MGKLTYFLSFTICLIGIALTANAQQEMTSSIGKVYNNLQNTTVTVELDVGKGREPICNNNNQPCHISPGKTVPVKDFRSRVGKGFTVIFKMDDIPQSEEGIKGVRAIPGNTLGNIRIKHHFEFIDTKDGYEAIMVFGHGNKSIKSILKDMNTDVDPSVEHPD